MNEGKGKHECKSQCDGNFLVSHDLNRIIMESILDGGVKNMYDHHCSLKISIEKKFSSNFYKYLHFLRNDCSSLSCF